jgi:hypothetical protein
MGLTKPRASQIFDLDYKQATRVITVSNVVLTGGAPAVVDGVSLNVGDRVLVTGQSTASENGLYAVSVVGVGSDGTWVRTSDGNEDGEISAGMIIMVTEGATYADTQWKLTTDDPIDIGVTSLTFVINILSDVGGTNTQVQFNDGGILAGSAGFTFDKTANVLTVGGNIAGSNFITVGQITATGNITGAYIIGDGSQLTGIATSYSDSNVAAYLASGTVSTNILTTGDVTAANFNTTSDARIKTNVCQIDNAMDIVNQLEGVFFDKNGVADLGLIAQQVEAVLPRATKTLDDEIQTKTVNYGGLVGVLIEAIKSNKKEIEELKNQINQLKS